MGNGVPSELRCQEQFQEVDQIQGSGKAALLLSGNLGGHGIHHDDKYITQCGESSPSDSIADPIENHQGGDHD